MPYRYRNSLVACARWENETIQEWVEYHRSIGFDHVFLYCNDDDPQELLARVQPFNENGTDFVTFHHHPIQGDQRGMYEHFLRTHRHETERFIFLDIDEFVCLHEVNDINRFLEPELSKYDDIIFNWVWFGNSGYVERPVGSVLINYTYRARGPFVLTKHLIRSDVFDSKIDMDMLETPFHHAIQSCHYSGMSVVNVLGEDFAAYVDAGVPAKAHMLSVDNLGARILAKATISHYAFKSEDDLMRRVRRGTGGSFEGQTSWQALHESGNARQFFEPLNEVKDTYLRDYWRAYLDSTGDAVPRPVMPNIAPLGEADQSSISPWSLGGTTREDATGAVTGAPDGTYHFHTSEEDEPWWQVRFPRPALVSGIVIYNRLSNPHRSMGLIVEALLPDGRFDQLAEWTRYVPFGGVDGDPFVISLSEPVRTELIRLRLRGRGYLHLDHVEIIGVLPDDADDRHALLDVSTAASGSR